MSTDRNFDDLAEKFQRKIYGSLKGQARIAVLRRDLERLLPVNSVERRLAILDAGGGQGQLSLRYAAQGHKVVLCDISERMLELASSSAHKLGVSDRVTLIHDRVQNLAQHETGCFDLVLNHALLEWTAQPEQILPLLAKFLAEDGVLSTAFYNHAGVLFRNLVRGNLFKVAKGDWQGDEGSLTPSNPPTIEAVEAWHQAAGLEIISRSGIRVFSDYLNNNKLEQISREDIIAQELTYSTHPDLWRMARYIHMISRPGGSSYDG